MLQLACSLAVTTPPSPPSWMMTRTSTWSLSGLSTSPRTGEYFAENYLSLSAEKFSGLGQQNITSYDSSRQH